jgi:dTDP-glucose 4,6-dehydratase
VTRIAVTGGAGFIGSHLCDRLIGRGDEVICIDDLSTGRTRNIDQLLGHERFELVEADIVSTDLVALLGDGPLDAVMNLASPASPPEFLRRPIETLEVGSVGTRHALDLALATGARFLLASTSETYGDPLVHPQPETYLGNVDAIGPRGCYDEAKRFAEAITMAYHRMHGVDVRIVRIFNTYGPRMRPDDGRVVTNFIGQALAGKPLTVQGEGTQTRSFLYVDDQVSGLLALLASDVTTPVNIGYPGEHTMLELAEIVLELTGSSSEIEHLPLPEGDPKVRRPDITVARTRLGWEPTVSIRDGLSRTITALRAELAG